MTRKLTQLATCSLCMRSTDFSALKSQLMEHNYKLQFIIIIMERNLILFSSEDFDWHSFLSEDNITKTTSEGERRYASLIWLKEIELQLKSANHTLRLFDRLVIKSWIQCFWEQTRQKLKRRTIMAHDLRNQFSEQRKVMQKHFGNRRRFCHWRCWTSNWIFCAARRHEMGYTNKGLSIR